MTKLYVDDNLIAYKSTEIKAETTKAEIDGLLAKWQVKDVYWHVDWEHNDVWVQFKLNEIIDGAPVSVPIKVVCPTIWTRKKGKAEAVNWNVSMRNMWWFMKTHLETAYAMQSDKTVAFLAYIATSENHTLKDLIIPRLQRLGEIAALPSREDERRQAAKIIEANGEEAR